MVVLLNKLKNTFIATTICFFVQPSLGQERLAFTYLDLVAPSIVFEPVMFRNKSNTSSSDEYFIFSFHSQGIQSIPGYEGQRCIVEWEMALELQKIQKELFEMGDYSLKVFDTYRPQQAVDFLGEWVQGEDDHIVKKYHYPNVKKIDFHDLSYIAKKSSHSLGTAVDLTIISTKSIPTKHRPDDFIGIFDPREIDMGHVGYLAFDIQSSHHQADLTDSQKENRKLLLNMMKKHNFELLRSEFWHYFYKRERNKTLYFNFPIKDDYSVNEDGQIIIESLLPLSN